MMIIEKTIKVDANAQEIWNSVIQIEDIATCIPGIEDVVAVEGDNKYKALAKEKIGPFKISLPVELTINEVTFPTMKLFGEGTDKFTKTMVKLDMQLTLEEQSEKETILIIEVDANMKGKLATLGQGMVNRKFSEKVEAFGENLAKKLERSSSNA